MTTDSLQRRESENQAGGCAACTEENLARDEWKERLLRGLFRVA
jgi:hypothetical protein